jgi:LPXTG-motif cell wall-anchored protein
MKKLSVRKLFIILAILATITLLSTAVHATGGIINPIAINGTSTNTTDTTTNTTVNTTTSTTVTTNTVTANTTTTTTTNSDLPKTGDASDYVIFLFIAVCLVVSIVAYRKFRNYNI